MAERVERRCDVAVIGAGLAGLAAATRLEAAGVDCVVLEARDRVGGRTWSREIAGATFDLGAQWLGPTQTRMFELTHQLGAETFPTYHRGKKILDVDGRVTRYRLPVPLTSPRQAFQMGRFLLRTLMMSRRVPLEHPEHTSGAPRLDARSLAEFETTLMRSPATRRLVDVAIRTIFGAEASEVSLLYFLFYMRSGGGLLNLIGIDKAAQQTRFVGGAQAIALGLAGPLGDRVQLGRPVNGICSDGDGVTITAGELEVRARRAIVALPPALIGGLGITPALPAQRAQLQQRVPMGITIKVHLIYERAFWRERGLSGEVAATRGPASVVFDNCSHDGAVPALLAFLVGDPARRWAAAPAVERRAALLAQLATYFGQEALSPVEVIEQNWADEPFTAGCPVGVRGPGTMTALGSISAPIGRLHFAGTETAPVWCGYMEGAVRSGERAAAQCVAAL